MGHYLSRSEHSNLSQQSHSPAYNILPTHSPLDVQTVRNLHTTTHISGSLPPSSRKRTHVSASYDKEDETSKGYNKRRRVENTYHQVGGDLKHTSEYIFTQLFDNGLGSDVCVTALGQSWQLHKVLLRQSKFFDCMFSGRWARGNEANVTLTIDDPNIEVAALSTCFASMYGDDISITADGLISLVATATLLQLDNVLDRCLATARDTLGPDNIFTLYETACTYGMTSLETLTIEYLQSRLLLYAEGGNCPPITWLLGLNTLLMERIVASSALWVFTVELDVYSLCCVWMYTQVERDTIEENLAELSPDDCARLVKGWSEVFYEQWAKDNSGGAFLESEEGQEYIPVFKALRLEHVINAIGHLNKVESDSIIPGEWVQTAVYNCWCASLKQGQITANLPSSEIESLFELHSIRWGKKVATDRYSQWRWAGYCAIDLVLSFNPTAGKLSIQRLGARVDATPFRRIHYRLRLMTLDDSGRISWKSEADSTITLELLKTRIYPIATIPEAASATLYVSFTVLLESPIT